MAVRRASIARRAADGICRAWNGVLSDSLAVGDLRCHNGGGRLHLMRREEWLAFGATGNGNPWLRLASFVGQWFTFDATSLPGRLRTESGGAFAVGFLR